MKKLTKKQIKKLERKERNKLDKEWSLKVRKEFNNKCIVCGRKDRINTHHLFPREIKLLRYEPLNGVILCPLHHRFAIDISAHRNPLFFHMFYIKDYNERFKQLIAIYRNLLINRKELKNALYQNKRKRKVE